MRARRGGASAFVTVLALSLSLSASRGARAEESREPAGQQSAKQLTAEAAVHYRLGRFREALDAYTKAYEAAQLPALLFNIGQCHKMLGSHERAVFFFEGFLRERPEAKSRAMVEALIAESKKEQAARAAAAQATAQTAAARRAEAEAAVAAARAREREHEIDRQGVAEDQAMAQTRGRAELTQADAGLDRQGMLRRARPKLVAGGTLLSLGVVGLAAGLGLGLATSGLASDLEAARARGAIWDEDAQANYDRGVRYAAAATGLYVVGGVLVTSGAVLLILGGRDRSKARRLAWTTSNDGSLTAGVGR